MIFKGDSKQMATKQAKYGKAYNTPIGLQEDSYYEMMYDLMDYVNRKCLTTRQAQHLFADCFDMVLDIKTNGECEKECTNENYLKSIADSLNIIKEQGLGIYNRSWV